MAIWHNGHIIEPSAASVTAISAGHLVGWGVFTTIGLKNARPLWLERHLIRLRRDALRCGVSIFYSDEELERGLTELVHQNQISNGMARITCNRTADGFWNTEGADSVTILAVESPASLTRGLRVGFATAPSQGELRGAKTTSYLPYFWSWREASRQGWDEVVFLNNGLVVEASRSTVFWVRNGVLQTSPLSLGPLDGIGRALTLEWAKSEDIKVDTSEADCSELLGCDEAFLISAATGPRAIGSFVTDHEEVTLPESAAVFERFRAWWDSQ